jgi:uncharacterized protein (TIGR03437 family)
MRLSAPSRALFTLLAAAGLASGYYHFTHYASRFAPFNAIPEKFDLAQLPDKTVSFFVSENGPAAYAVNDSFPQVVSQIRAAAKVWSEVETSDLRLRFGGLGPSPSSAVTPSIDVLFEDLPPGVNGYGGPTVKNEINNGPAGAFVPIQRSTVVLSRDIANRPSWSERFYLTAVHEFGHALGLQHSFVGGAMATEITRATTKIRPINPDDVAGVSLLYPARNFRDSLGSIAGRVRTVAGENVPMASVVAITPGGAAIGTVTHPDGSYRIDGIPQGQYYVYAHPLPPTLLGEATPGNVVLPLDNLRRPFDDSFQFDTVFYPASRQPFVTVPVGAGNLSENINFSVTRRATAPSIHSVQTYSFPGQIAVKPAHVYTNGTRNLVIAAGYGLIANSQPLPGLSVSTLSGAVSILPNGIRPYPQAPASYLQLDVQFAPISPEGPAHLIFTRNNDLYVLPYGLRVAERSAPQIEAVSQRNEQGELAISGLNLSANTTVTFGGVPAAVRSYDEAARRLTVTPPAGYAGQPIPVAAFNSDGQSNLFVQNAPFYTYEGEPAALPAANFTSLAAGAESVIEITGAGFLDGQTVFGFGTPDIAIRRLWVLSPTRAIANVVVSPAAAAGAYTVSVLNGLRLTSLPAAVQVTNARTPWLAFSSAQSLVAGTTATIQVNNLAFTSSTALQLTVNNVPAQILSVEGASITFLVPASIPTGVAVLRLQQAADVAQPLAVPVTPPPALISSITVGFGQPINNDRPLRPGDLVSLLITGLPEAISLPGAQPRISIYIGQIEHRAVLANPIGGALQIQFVVQPIVTPGNATLYVTIDSLTTQPLSVPVRNN